MNNVFLYNEILSQYKGECDNYWSDFLIIEAIEKIDDFSGNDWDCLLMDLSHQNKNELWYLAFFDTLSEVENYQYALICCITIFHKMTHSVKVEIINTINAILANHSNQVDINIINQIKNIANLFQPQSELEKIVLNSLYLKLNKQT